MPRYVDHEQRRLEVIDVATELVTTHGRASLTARNVARAAGCSTKVVSHYFTDMADLLHATYTAAAKRAGARLDTAMAADPTDLQGFIEAVLPLDVARRRDWSIWFAFWSEALTSEQLGADQRERARNITERITSILEALIRSGQLPPSCEAARAARRLSALIPGIAGQALFDPQHWTPKRQREVIAGELTLLGADAPNHATTTGHGSPRTGAQMSDANPRGDRLAGAHFGDRHLAGRRVDETTVPRVTDGL